MTKPWLPLLSLILLLAACNQTNRAPEVYNPPAPDATSKTLNLVSLAITEQTSGELASQAFTQVGGLTFTPTTKDQLNASNASARFVMATFSISNNTGSPLSNLTLVAVDTGTNLANTAFVSASDDGDNVTPEAIALRLKPAHGMMASGNDAVVDNSKADFQAFSKAEASALKALNTSITTAFPYAFVARCLNNCTANPREIPPGENTGEITIAFSLPRSVVDATLDELVVLFLFTTDSNTKVTESLEEQGASGADARADALGAGTPIRLLGTSATTAAGNPTERLCQLRTAGTPTSPTAFLVNFPNPIFVDDDATGLNNGTSWTNAFPNLQDAIALANPLCSSEIWVAAGTYYPDEGSGQGDNDPTSTFQLKNNLAIYGGFDTADTQRSDADPFTNLSILSGDLDQSGSASAVDAYHVVSGSGTDVTAILQGVTITKGNAAGSTADTQRGGGMINDGGSPTLKQLIFTANTAQNEGGGMMNLNSASPSLTNVSFYGNSAVQGGGVYNLAASMPTLTNVIFSGNTASADGGGMLNKSSANASLINVSFSTNTASNGGGMLNETSSPTISNSIFFGNTATSGPSILNTTASPSVSFSLFEDASLPAGSVDGGSNLFGATGPFVNADGADNTVGTTDDNLQLVNNAKAIDAGDNTANSTTTDIAGNPRKMDDTGVTDTGNGSAPLIDMGALEKQTNTPLACSQSVIYVNAGSSGTTGNSWADALPTLQDALACATSGQEIWLAAGTYYPDEGAGQTDNARTSTFQLKNGVGIYGGFDTADTSKSDADPTANLTILSGDLDKSGTINDSDAYHVTTGSGTDSTAVLEGVTITGGNATGSFPDNRGAGMFNDSGSPSLNHVTFSSNTAEFGGGMSNQISSSPTLSNVTFTLNTASEGGGGIFNFNASSPTLSNVTFTGNTAGTRGAGMFNTGASSPTLSNVTFTLNTTVDGAGMYNQSSSAPTLTEVTFSDNTASNHGAGMFNNNGATPSLTNVTFSGNTASAGGGGMFNDSSSPSLTDVTFSSNTAGEGGGMYNQSSSSPSITNVIFTGNTAAIGGSGGGMYNNSSSPTLINTTFSSNTALGGGGMLNDNASPSITNVIFTGNTADIDGGGMFNLRSAPILTNVTFSSNTADIGGAISNVAISTPTITNGVFFGNSATFDPSIANSASSPAISYSLFEDASLPAGSVDGGNNLFGTSDPFVDADGADDIFGTADDNLQLIDNAAAIDAGDNTANSTTTDLADNPRKVDDTGVTDMGNGTAPIIDMGALERQTNSSAADPTLSISESLDPVLAGSGVSNLTYVITITNNGTQDATGVEVTEAITLPAGVTIDSITPSAGTSYAPPNSLNGTWMVGSLSSSASATLTVDVTVSNSASAGTDVITNTATINISNPADPNTTNNSVSEATSIDVPCSGSVIYVNAGSSGLSGNSWADALPTLQDALACAISGQEIWLAAGTYYPDEGAGQTDNARTSTFQLKNGVGIYGGFDTADTLRSDADPTTNPTILSGDLDQSGSRNVLDAYHVVTGSGTNTSAVIESVTITGGHANASSIPNNRGGGIFNNTGSPTVRNVTISGNNARNEGGGMFNNNASSPTLSNVTFTANTARFGGGLYNLASSSSSLTNVTFLGNEAFSSGGAIYNRDASAPSLTNVIFSGNTAERGGGVYNNASSPMLSNVTFSGNTTEFASAGDARGGGMFNTASSNPTIVNSVFYGNVAVNGGPSIFNDASAPTISFSLFEDASLPSGSVGAGGNRFGSGDPFVDADGADNTFGTADDDLNLESYVLAIDAGNNAANSTTTDAAGNPRKVDDASVANTGNGSAPIIDMGALERQSNSTRCDLNVIYVNASSLGTTGNSWADALPTLQDALACATSGQEIWLAAGTYYPDEGAGQSNNNRSSTFQLKNGVGIYGGFDTSDTQRSDADPSTNLTILSGDIRQNGSTKAYHVTTSSGTDSTAILKGVTITNGNASDLQPNNRGGGMFNDGGSPTLRNIIFSGNTAASEGGGMSNNNSASPTLTNVTFTGNASSTWGGGMHNDNGSSPTLSNVTFAGNTATEGGGMYNVASSSPTLTNVTFSANTAANGGGMFNLVSSSPSLTNVTFTGNTASMNGGGMFNDEGSSATLINVTFSGNTADLLGGGMYNTNASATLTNVIFSGNIADLEGGGMYNDNTSVTLTNSTFSKNSASNGSGGGVYNFASSATITNGIFYGNTSIGSAISNQVGSSATISFTLFEDASLPANSVDGRSNILNASDPFVDADGADNTAGTADDDLSLKDNAAAIDAGDNTANSTTTDLAGQPRKVNDVGVTDTGNGSSPIIDMGALEKQTDSPLPQSVITVAAGNNGTTGSSWADALPTLQDALAIATSGQEIWVAAGTYYPDEGARQSNNNRASTFQLKNGVSIYGGFDTLDAQRSEADPGINLTILSGDLDQSGSWNDNDAYHVVTGSSTNSTALLEGVTITAGNANASSIPNNRGGGVFNNGGSPTLTNVIIRANNANADGGGMFNNNGASPTLTNVIFSGNQGADGGAMHNRASSAPRLINVTVSGNRATNIGGGVFNDNASPIISNSIFYGNGSSVRSFNNASSTVTYSLFDDIDFGGTNIQASSDPFVDADGADNTFGTADDDVNLKDFSVAIDAGDNTANSSSTDAAGNPRKVDDTGVIIDTGNGSPPFFSPPFIDMGALEKQSNSPICTGSIIYVSAGSLGTTGNSWADALPTLQDALACATSGKEIWIAAGTYYPDEGGGQTNNSLASSFQLKNGVAIYGGFDTADTQRSDADPTANPTILSGDLRQDGSTKAYHVTTSSGTDSTAILEGVTITNGNASVSIPDDRGGGIYNDGGSPTLSNIIFSGNTASFGGGMYNDGGSPTLSNIIFSGNTASSGGGMYNDGGSPTLSNITYSGNTASFFGGGMYNQSGSPTISNSIFFGNTATNNGPSIHNLSGLPRISFTLFEDDSLPANSLDEGNNLFGANGPFLDPDGADNTFGTADDNLQLVDNAKAIDAGDNTANSTTTDAAGNPRRYNDTGVTDTGNGTAPIIDMGALEKQTNSP